MKAYEYLEKLRNMPEKKKIVVLWTIIVVLAIIMGIFWIGDLLNNMNIIFNNIR